MTIHVHRNGTGSLDRTLADSICIISSPTGYVFSSDPGWRANVARFLFRSNAHLDQAQIP